ncbi:MAG: universal stress protein [Thermoleophilia bacterium]|nr:universal stress protein [Thermoleophilia bacterium]
MVSSPESRSKDESPAQKSAFDTVAVCVDYSDAAHDAIELGRALAGAEGQIVLVHVAEITSQLGWVKMIAIPDLDWEPIGTELLKRLSEEAAGAETVLLRGHPSISIMEWVERASPDVIVCAARHGVVSRTVLGSVSSYLAYHLPCPVAIARPGIERRPRFTHVAACVDADEQSHLVLEAAERVAGAHLARLSAVHVMDDLRTYGHLGWVPDPLEWRQEWEAMMDEIVRDLRCEQVLLEGVYAGPAITDWAAEHDVDLLIAAAHRRGVERWFLGGFASHLAHHAPCDVLISR